MGDFVYNGDVIKPSEDLSWRDVGGELVALNTTSGQYYSFNSVGREVWLAIAEGLVLEDLIDRIVVD
ncbi:MAG: PqqD family protein, partial [Kiritimatiellae bacterium]|nr:PqqD family protein [Kiritimatiellia bacterium]